MNKTNNTIYFFLFTLLTILNSCQKKSETPVPDADIKPVDNADKAYYFKYKSNGQDYHFKNGVQNFGIGNSVFKRVGSVTVTEYKGGLFKRESNKITTLSFGTGLFDQGNFEGMPI